jgi:hypothetical protein
MSRKVYLVMRRRPDGHESVAAAYFDERDAKEEVYRLQRDARDFPPRTEEHRRSYGIDSIDVY